MILSGNYGSAAVSRMFFSLIDMRARIDYLRQAQKNIQKLGEDQDHIYVLNRDHDSSQPHYVWIDAQGKINIDASNMALALHEITHVAQSLAVGKLNFDASGKLTYAPDPVGLFDRPRTPMEIISAREIEAYRTQYALDPATYPGHINPVPELGFTGLYGIDAWSVGNI